MKWGDLFADCSILEMATRKRLPFGDLSPSPLFSKVVMLKTDKVSCFDTLLEVFILKVLRCVFLMGF